MAKKDTGLAENIDHDSHAAGSASKSDEKNQAPQNDSTSASEIKNAHASGDGSFGRSESSLPDEESKNAGEAQPY